MTPHSIRRGTIVLLAALCLGRGANAVPPQTLSLQPESAIWLVGDSTLHAFTCLSKQFQVTAEADAPGTEAILQRNALKRLDVVVPVKTLQSKESALDKNMYKAMKAEQYPEILFRLATYEISASTTGASASHVKANGTLTIAGHEQPVVLEGEILPGMAGFRVQGQYKLRMSDYGIKPPTMMMGTIRVKDDVVVHFDLQLQAPATVQ